MLNKRAVVIFIFLCFVSGALSISGNIKRFGIDYFSMLIIAIIAISSFCSLAKVKELRDYHHAILPLTILGFLPLIYQSFEIILGSYNLSISYTFKFLPYATLGLLILFIKNQSLVRIESIVRLIAMIIAIRSVITFTFPEAAIQNGFIKQYGYIDSFYVYEYVNGIPRVFFPGLALVILGIFITFRDLLIGKAGFLRLIEISILFLSVLTGLTRGIIIVSALSLLIMTIVLFIRNKVSIDRTKITVGFFMTGMFIFSLPQLINIIPFEQIYSSDRASLATDNISWRQMQVGIAFNQIDTLGKLTFGVGPNGTIPSDPISQDYYAQTNELHFSYASLLWSFGIFGSALFFISIAGLLISVRGGAIRQPQLYPWIFAFVVILAIGIYNPTVTLTDWNAAIALIYSVLLVNINEIRKTRTSKHE